jgi:hypothetical protein
VIVALVLVFLVSRFGVQPAAIYAAGAVRRLRGWQIVIMGLAGAGIDLGLEFLLDRMPDLHIPLPLVGLANGFLFVVLLGAGEMLFLRLWSWRVMGRMALMTVGAVCVLRTVIGLSGWCALGMNVPFPLFGYMASSLGHVSYYFLLAIVAWTIVPLALRWRDRTGRRMAVVVGGWAASGVAALLVFFVVLPCPLAHWSLAGNGPLDRHCAIYILEYRGQDADVDLVWRVLEATDWTVPIAYGGWREDSVVIRGYEFTEDWRKTAVEMVAKRAPAEAAARLSRMLQDRPSAALADCSAKVLAEGRRYEAAPILLRYSLVAEWSSSYGSRECTEALKAMRVPQASLAILMSAASWAKSVGDCDSESGDLFLSDETRESVKGLLGADAGKKYRPWLALYDKVINDVPTPLTPEVRAEADRAVMCAMTWVSEAGRLVSAGHKLARVNLAKVGSGNVLTVIREWYAQHKGEGPRAEVPPDVIEALRVLENHEEGARQQLRVDEPDWNVLTTDELEKEAAAYVERAEAKIREFFPDGA